MLVVIISALFWGSVCGAHPRPCCMPSKFSGTLISIDGSLQLGQTIPKISDTYVYMDYDFDKGQEFIEVKALVANTTRRASEARIYNYYPQSKQYILLDSGTCHVRHLDPNAQLPNCIPDNFAYKGSYDIGSLSNSIRTHIFSGFLPGRGEIQFDYHVAATDCALLFELHHGTTLDGKNMVVTNWIYSNMIWNSTKVGVFDLPPACDHATPFQPSGKRDVTAIDTALTSLSYFYQSP